MDGFAGLVARLRREANAWTADRRARDWRFATASRLQRSAGVTALRDQIAERLVDLDGRLDQHAISLGDHAAAIGELQLRPVDAVLPTMSWIEQAAVTPRTLVSVILATRDRCELLPRAIASVQAQTYPNFELIVVDDGSEDATPEVIAELDHPRIRTIRTAGVGVAAARNAALAIAGGEIVAYVDDDNAMHPGWLKAVVWGFGQRPDTETLYGAFVVDDLARNRGDGPGEMPSLWLHAYRAERLASHNLADIGALAHRAGLAEARFDEDLAMFSDWDLLARLTTHRDPLVLPAIACFYSTDAPHRISGGPSETLEAELVRRRVRAARGLEAPAGPARDLEAGPHLRAVLGAGPPLSFGPWTLQPRALELVLERIAGPDAVAVECGSGESTIAIARHLRAQGGGHAWALEHHRGWAAEIRRRIAAEGLDRWATVVDAPLEEHPLAPGECRWYAAEAIERLPSRIDLLLVDGPPASEPLVRARYPALPALAHRLAPGAVVVLDDAGRSGERWVLDRWESEGRMRFERRDEDGVAIGVSSAEPGTNENA